MKREDFKDITKTHFTTCETIIENGGACYEIGDCIDDCPFSRHNSTNDKMCCDNGYSDEHIRLNECDVTLLKSCRLFLETFKKGEKK